MKKAIVIFSWLTASVCHAQTTTVPSARAVLAKASTAAAVSHKKILLIFHASWCGWCRKMDSSLSDTACKKLFDKYFVITHLTVQENKAHVQEENPGALELMNSYKAAEAGLPFWVILDEKGKLLQDGFIREQGSKPANIGCPANEEVAAFTAKLAATSGLTADELETIRHVFRRNEQ